MTGLPENQCPYVTTNDSTGYLCCGEERGHYPDTPHRTCYGTEGGAWMTVEEWKAGPGKNAHLMYMDRGRR